jgi:spermidine synthase
MNRGALEDPRIETEFGDAFQYVRTSSEQFDAIYLDFPYAKDYNLSKLYSREFFHFVRERLAEGGFAVLDAPGSSFFGLVDESGNAALVPGGEWEIYYNTIHAAGFEAIVPFRSALEADNPAAYVFLDEWAGTPDFMDPGTGLPHPELRAEWIRRTVTQHQLYFREGFMTMWKDEAPAAEYRDLCIELSLLNEKRFHLSFPPPLAGVEEVDAQWVNSILRPTLPANGIWLVRRPWN